MVDLPGFIWRPIKQSKMADTAHLIPEPLEYGAKALCGAKVDPFHSTHAPPMPCFACTQEAKRQLKEASDA